MEGIIRLQDAVDAIPVEWIEEYIDNTIDDTHIATAYEALIELIKAWENNKDNKLLKPCPFCGGVPKLVEDEGQYKIFCTNSACDAQYGWCADKDYIISMWNKRAD